MNNVEQVTQACSRGAALATLAQATGLSVGTVHNWLSADDVEMRQRGPRPQELAAMVDAPRPRRAGLRAASERSGQRANPRAGRPARSNSIRSSTAATETVDVERLHTQLLDAWERSDAAQRQAVVSAISDDQVWLAVEALKAAVDDAFAGRRS